MINHNSLGLYTIDLTGKYITSYHDPVLYVLRDTGVYIICLDYSNNHNLLSLACYNKVELLNMADYEIVDFYDFADDNSLISKLI